MICPTVSDELSRISENEISENEMSENEISEIKRTDQGY